MRLSLLLMLAMLVTPQTALAASPCDFKGLVVGTKSTPAAIMSALGIAKFKSNPAHWSFEKAFAYEQKYGPVTSDAENWEIGPYCQEDGCRVPYGVSVGNNNIPVDVLVSLRDSVVTEIDVSFGMTYWEELRPVLDQKYGSEWKVQREPFPVTDYETKKSSLQEKITILKSQPGIDTKTGDHCQIWATSVDWAFAHHDALGPYHSQFVIKLISNNF